MVSFPRLGISARIYRIVREQVETYVYRENPPDGAIIDYFLSRPANEVRIEIREASNQLVRKYSNADEPDSVIEKDLHVPMYWVRPAQVLSSSAGAHRFLWDLHSVQPEGIPRSYPISAIFHNTASQPTGPWVEPGRYTVILRAEGKRFTRQLTVKMDPRVKTPTRAQRISVEAENGVLDAMLKRWESFKRTDLPAIKARLKAAGLGTLDVM